MVKKSIFVPILANVLISALIGSTVVWAGGDKNAYNNPNGNPDEYTFEAPYMNVGDGRMMVFCAEDEMLVVTPVEPGAIEVICVPATK